jgi:hypothetical protein
VFVLGSVPEDSASAVVAGRGKRMNGALKAVESVRGSTQRYLKGFVVAVPADFASFHECLKVGSELSGGLRSRDTGRRLCIRHPPQRLLGPYVLFRLSSVAYARVHPV